MYYKALLILCLFLANPVHSQVLMNRDSLVKLLPSVKNDTNAVLLYINLGEQFESNEPETAKNYYRKAGELSNVLKYTAGKFKFISGYTYVLNMQGLYDSSLLLNLQGVEIARRAKDSLNLAKALFNSGTSYRLNGDYENAIKFYDEGKRIFIRFGDEETEMKANDILQTLYFDMKQFKKGIEYGEKAVTGFRSKNDLPWLGSALNNLGMNYSSIKEFNKAKQLFEEALQIGDRISDKNMVASQNLNLGDIFIQKGEYDKMKPYMEKALLLARELGLHESEVIALKGLSYYYHNSGQYEVSKNLANEALAITYQFNLKKQRNALFTHLSNLAYSMQDKKLGEYYATESTLLGDSLLNEKLQQNSLELEKKFEAFQKESKIKELEASGKVQSLTIKQKNTLNYLLAGAVLSLIIISLLIMRNDKHKQTIQQQRIAELETQQQLTATEAVLKGEEQERSRLAKDLHDGLGGMLSGIKFSMNNMKGNLIMTPENAQAFERSMDMLDSSIKEMLRVAHNMMPESLVKFGLDTALKDFCN
ncbi:MAG: tetratricopeptide repeat protein, partial [Ginsengibacter sp.]